jgi:hypothetical protein
MREANKKFEYEGLKMAETKKSKKVRFVLSRDMTEDQVIATIKKACEEAGIPFEGSSKKKDKPL